MTRFVVYGAGAIGGVLGARLLQCGHEVVLIARGAHLDAIRASGLRVESEEGSVSLRIDAVASPEDADVGEGNIVVLAMKSQHTWTALDALAGVVPDSTPIVCAQNGVENERTAIRLFPRVYGVCVICPAGHLDPGVVRAYASPTPGILDIGRYPDGIDDLATEMAAAFRASGFASEALPDIMRWKYRKLLANLRNAISAVCGPEHRAGQLGQLVTREGERVLAAAGIPHASAEEDAARRGDLLKRWQPDGDGNHRDSSWQSLQRGTGSIEADYLNGEIVRLGRDLGVATPVNELLQLLARRLARSGAPPGTMSVDTVLAQLSAATSPLGELGTSSNPAGQRPPTQ